MSARVEMNQAMLDTGERLGIARYEASLKDGRRSMLVSRSLTAERAHVLGALAEVAVAHAEMLPINCTVHRGPGFSRAARRPDVGDWQVKYSSLIPPCLKIPLYQAHQRQKARFLLVAGASPVLWIIGWCPSWELFNDANVRPIGKLDWFVAPRLYDYVPKRSELYVASE